MDHTTAPIGMILHPVRYFRKWTNVYRQWEFWALSAAVIGGYYLLKTTGTLPKFLLDHERVANVLMTAIIMLPMPFFMTRRKGKTRVRNRWFINALSGALNPNRGLSVTIASLLIMSAVAFMMPIFIDIQSKKPLSGIELIAQHPIALAVPMLCLVSAGLILRSYREWRWLAFFWAIGAGAGLFAVAGYYTDTDKDISGFYALPAFIAAVAPILISLLCLKIGKP